MQDRDHETYVYDHTQARRMIEAADPDEGPWPIHGVAVAAGDVLHDQDGNPVLITEEELENAEYSRAAQKLTKDHPDYDPTVEPPPVDATVGNNSMSYSEDGEAVVYDATTHDEEIAAGVNGETYGVSIHAGFRAGEPDPETGIPVAEDIVFHDTSVVTLGDSPSNTAQYGGRSDVAAWARSGGLEAAVSDMADDTPDAAPDADDETVGLLRGLANRFGFSLEADAGGAQPSDEGPDSPPGTDPDADDANADTDPDMTNREDHIEYLTANADYDEGDFEGMTDEGVEQTREFVEDADGDEGDEDEENSTETDTQTGGADTLGDMTPEQLGDVLREQGFVTEDAVGDAVEASRSAATKGEQVEEIIAESEDYGEDDRDELMASSPTVVEKIHKSEARPGAAQVPGVGGSRSRAQAAVGGSDEHDLEDFRTGGEE